MTRIDAEVVCPSCNNAEADPPGKPFKRFYQISLDLDLTTPKVFKSGNVCMYCKEPLPVKVKVELEDSPCCSQPIIRNHFDLIQWRKKDGKLIHRKCANCGKEILLRESVEVDIKEEDE